MAKPPGWWSTHPTLLSLSVATAWDSNGDGFGDFEGIRQHLDYLVDMGISGLLLKQVTRFDDDFEWAGLVAQDWFDVDPLYGTIEDFDRLARDCETRDFKLLVMAVPEYLGWHHPDYVAARKAREQGTEDPRVAWFQWQDDGTVTTTWNHPGPDFANPDYMDAYLRHIAFWMDRGIAGWDVDSIASWLNLNVEAVRKLTDFVKSRGGFVTSENMALEHDVIRHGGFNAGTGVRRTQLYNETRAILECDPSYIRHGLVERQALIDHDMFPYQQMGDPEQEPLPLITKLPMWRLQVAFSAALPDQAWVLANDITYPSKPMKPPPIAAGPRKQKLDWAEIDRQQGDADSPYEFFRRMFSLRAREKALAIGEIEELPTDCRGSVFAAFRTSEDGTARAVTVFYFGAGSRRVTVFLGDRARRLTNYLNDEDLMVNEHGALELRVGSYGFKLLRVVE
jgi:glycosidase